MHCIYGLWVVWVNVYVCMLKDIVFKKSPVTTTKIIIWTRESQVRSLLLMENVRLTKLYIF